MPCNTRPALTHVLGPKMSASAHSWTRRGQSKMVSGGFGRFWWPQVSQRFTPRAEVSANAQVFTGLLKVGRAP